MPRNEETDKAAKEGTMLLTPTDTICTLVSLKRITKAEACRAINSLWAIIAPLSYNNLHIKYNPKLDELHLDQASLGHILAARSYHRDFADYHLCFHYHNAIFHCSCGRRKSPLYFYFCLKSNARKSLYKGCLLEAILWLLRTVKGLTRLTN